MVCLESQVEHSLINDDFDTDDTSMDWVGPQYSRSMVNKAGAILIADDSNVTDLEEVYPIINNWRSSHSRPLSTFRYGLRLRAKRVENNPLVAQRIKRLSSISLKLKLFPNMKLSQMQDIGGCRVMVSSVSKVYEIVNDYKASSIKHNLLNEDDYITNPKHSGYRSYHLIYSYYSDRKATHNGLRIEVQIRSQLQHAWATAVETVGTFIRQALKSSLGEKEWLRFFALMGSAIAVRERMPPIPDTPTNRRELKTEIRKYASDLDVDVSLRAFGRALEAIVQPEIAGADYYLLQLDPSAMRIKITSYTKKELDRASNDYLSIEKQIAGSNSDAVLVAVDSMASLRRAYPNYFLDTQRFLEAVKQAIN